MDWIKELEIEEDRTLKKIYLEFRNYCLAWLNKKFDFSQEDNAAIFQESVVTFYLNVKRKKLIRIENKIENYLIGICKNIAYNKIKQESKISTTNKFPILALNEEVDEIKVKEDRLQKIEDNIKHLGAACQQILNSFYFEKKSMSEIMDLMQYGSVNSVKTQKYKCIKRLQALVLNTID